MQKSIHCVQEKITDESKISLEGVKKMDKEELAVLCDARDKLCGNGKKYHWSNAGNRGGLI